MNRNGELHPRPALDPRLSWRPAERRDLDAWAGLIARTAAVEQPVWFERQADLEQILESKNNPVTANTIIGFDPEGVARAYGRITKNRDGDKANGSGCVDPEWQGSGIGTSLLGWMEQRTRDRFAEDARPAAGADAGGAGAVVPRPRLRLYTEQQHQHQAALFASSDPAVVAANMKGDFSMGEKLLLAQAGAQRADPTIRGQLQSDVPGMQGADPAFTDRVLNGATTPVATTALRVPPKKKKSGGWFDWL